MLKPVSAPVSTFGLSDYAQAVNDSFVPLKVYAAPHTQFAGTLQSVAVDGVFFSLIEATPHSVERTAELASRGDRPFFKLSLQLSGTGFLVQGGRETLLRSGDAAIYSTDTPYSLVGGGDFKMLVMMLDHRKLGMPAEMLSEMTAVRMPTSNPIAYGYTSLLASIASDLSVLRGLAGSRIARAAVDLTTAMYTAELGGVNTDPRAALLQGVMGYIDDNLANPRLGPNLIAEANNVSRRYLYTLFEQQGVTVLAWVKQRRLEHCRRDLTDTRLAALPVAAIGARWGFGDPAHFSRAFKEAYGVSPSVLRREAFAAVSPR